MSITKRLRFEVFKRDGFTCKYCGRTPPKIILEPDHVIPVCEGGEDVINNLVAACFDCNRGKSGIPLIAIPESLEKDAKRRREKLRQVRWIRAIGLREKALEERKLDAISDTWMVAIGSNPDRYEITVEARETARQFLRRLPFCKVNKAASLVWKGRSADQQFRYFCGACWGMVRDLESENIPQEAVS